MNDTANRTDFDDLDLTRKGWLIRFLRQARPVILDDAAWPADPSAARPAIDDDDSIVWAQTRIETLGVCDDASPVDAPVESARRRLLRQLLLLSRLSVECRRRILGRDDTHCSLNAAILLGATAGQMDAALDLLELRRAIDADPDLPDAEVAKRAADPAARIAAALNERSLDADHPMAGRAFEFLLNLLDARLFVRLASTLHRADPDAPREAIETAMQDQIAAIAPERQASLEAVALLVWSDGVLSRDERRLVTELSRIAGQGRPSTEKEVRTPASPDEIAAMITDPLTRNLVLREVIFAALVDGQLDADEQTVIRALAAAFEVDDATLLRLHTEVGALLTERPSVATGLNFGARLGRLRRATEVRVTSLVRRNLTALSDEAKKTGDLLQLLAKSPVEPLTDEENTRMRNQLVDLCKAVPALALFAAPGGSVLLPILARVLPFSILPSSFQDEVETL